MRRRLRAPALALLMSLGAAPACAPDESSVGGLLASAPGLVAATYDGTDFHWPSGVYRDANIDFEGTELNEQFHARGHMDHDVSIRWTGQLRIESDEAVTISFELRGRVRLWIDGASIIDDWRDAGNLREARGGVPPASRNWRNLLIEWDQGDGPMTARLRAGSAAQPPAIVPTTALRNLDP